MIFDSLNNVCVVVFVLFFTLNCLYDIHLNHFSYNIYTNENFFLL